MKKIYALLISALLILSIFAVPAAAEDYEWIDIWVTHFDNNGAEGAGVIFTAEYGGGAWWNHVAFAPVEGAENVYEVVELSLGASGEATPLSIPEGGFVYAVNVGNNWKDLCEQNGVTGDGSTGLWYDDPTHAEMPNYVTEHSQNWFAVTGTWLEGAQFIFDGIDFENQTVPTSTPDVEWYEEGYVCTAKIAVYTGEAGGDDPVGSESEAESEAEDESEATTESESGNESAETAESKSEESVEATESTGTDATEEEGGMNTVTLIAIIVAAVVVVAVVVIIIAKKKK